MCQYAENEFRKVRHEIHSGVFEVQRDVERDRHEWRAAIQTLRRTTDHLAQNAVRLRCDILQLDGRAGGQRSRSPSPGFREVTVTATEQELCDQLMHMQVAIREDRREWRLSIQELQQAIALLRQQMMTATAEATMTAAGAHPSTGQQPRTTQVGPHGCFHHHTGRPGQSSHGLEAGFSEDA